MRKLFGEILSFILNNFLPSLGFFVVYEFWGAFSAVAFAVVLTIAQLVVTRVRQVAPTPLFLLTSFFALAFGLVSLFFAEAEFYRFEPAAQNCIVGLLFLGSMLTRRSILGWIVLSLPARVRPDTSYLSPRYFRVLTLAWGLHFLLKSLIYLYLAQRVNLGYLILLRTLIGWAFALLLIGGEVLYRRRSRRAWVASPAKR